MKIQVFFVCLLALFAHTAVATDRPALPDTMPKWILKDMKKEARKKRAKTHKLGESGMEVQVMGKVVDGPEETDPGFWYMAIDFGAKVEAHCWVVAEPRYLYNMLITTANNMLDAAAEANAGELDAADVFFTDTGYRDEASFGVLERFYLLKTESQPLVGLQKARASQHSDTTFVCEHNELGYVESFERLFNHLVGTAKLPEQTEKPYYVERQLITIGDKQAGIASVSMTLDAEGDTRIWTETGMLVSFDGSDVITIDSSQLEFATPDGNLINTVVTSIENDEVARNLSLEQLEDNTWLVNGTEAGEAVNKNLGARDSVKSTLGQMFMMQSMLADPDAKSTQTDVWYPDVDIAAFTPMTVEILERTVSGTYAEVTTGEIVLNPLLDANGSAISSRQSVEGIPLNTERVFLRGTVHSPNR